MTTCPSYITTVNGTDFKFGLLCNSNAFLSESGVIVLPGTNVNHPDFMAALKSIHHAFPYYQALEWLHELEYPFSGEYKIQADLIVEAFEKQIIEIDFDTYVKAKNFQNGVYEYPPPSKPASKKKQPSAGFVYLLKSDTGHYKIGRTVDPKSRSKTFGIQLPFAIEFLALISTADMISLETELHRRFAGKRLSGEWFDLSTDDIEYIKGLAS